MSKLFNFFNFKKEIDFDYLEFERQIADNPLIKEYQEERARTERTMNEWQTIGNIAQQCNTLIHKYYEKIPHEDYEYFILHEGFNAFLPLSIKPFLRQWDQLVTIANPLSKATIKYIK